MASGMAGPVTVHTAAPAQRIRTMVSDVTPVGRYSPETFEAEGPHGVSGPAVGLADSRALWAYRVLLGRVRGRINLRDTDTSLERIRALVEAGRAA